MYYCCNYYITIFIIIREVLQEFLIIHKHIIGIDINFII